MKLRKSLIATLGIGTLAVGLLSVADGQIRQRERSPDKAAKATAKIGEKAPDFTLEDTTGESHTLSDYTADGKIVVLEWFNPTCPYVVRHHEKVTTMKDIATDFEEKDVVWLAINSTNEGHPAFGKDAESIKEWKIEYPVLLDAPGDVGRLYGAKTTPHMYVIDKKGILRYMGAIDNDARGRKSESDKVNYVRQALDEVIAGETVSEPETRAYGCGVKY